MSDYDLSLTGAQIDAALNKVHNADTSPINGSQNMITSDAVHDSLSGYVNTSDLATDFTTPSNTTVPTTQAVKNLVDDKILWARTQMVMTQQTGGLTWSNTIKHSSFTGFSTSGQQITIPSGTYFINTTWTNAFESGSNTSYAHWYLMEGSQQGTEIFKGYIDNAGRSFGSSIIISGGNYFMKLVNGYVTGTVYVNVLKIAS